MANSADVENKKEKVYEKTRFSDVGVRGEDGSCYIYI